MAAWKNWLNGTASGRIAESQPPDLEDVRAQVFATLRDCGGPMCERMRWRMDAARSAQDLWLLRSEIFQLIAYQHCQAEAAARINALIPAFEGNMPSHFLTRIESRSS